MKMKIQLSFLILIQPWEDESVYIYLTYKFGLAYRLLDSPLRTDGFVNISFENGKNQITAVF